MKAKLRNSVVDLRISLSSPRVWGVCIQAAENFDGWVPPDIVLLTEIHLLRAVPNHTN